MPKLTDKEANMLIELLKKSGEQEIWRYPSRYLPIRQNGYGI